MKLHDDYYEEERSSGSKMTYIYMLLIMSAVILGVMALVFWSNQSKTKSDGSGYAAAVAQKEAKAAETSKKMEANASESVISESKLTSNDLDIWSLPDTGREKKSSTANKKQWYSDKPDDRRDSGGRLVNRFRRHKPVQDCRRNIQWKNFGVRYDQQGKS